MLKSNSSLDDWVDICDIEPKIYFNFCKNGEREGGNWTIEDYILHPMYFDKHLTFAMKIGCECAVSGLLGSYSVIPNFIYSVYNHYGE